LRERERELYVILKKKTHDDKVYQRRVVDEPWTLPGSPHNHIHFPILGIEREYLSQQPRDI
jgi:hypothetical protein